MKVSTIRRIPVGVRLLATGIYVASGLPACSLASLDCLSSDPGCIPAIFSLRGSGAGISDAPGFFGTGKDGAFTAAAPSTVFLQLAGGSVNAGGANGVINAGVDYGAAGAGGSIYLRGNSVSIGTSLVTATGGSTPDVSSVAGAGPIRIDSRTFLGSSNPIAGYGSTVLTIKSPLEQ